MQIQIDVFDERVGDGVDDHGGVGVDGCGVIAICWMQWQHQSAGASVAASGARHHDLTLL